MNIMKYAPAIILSDKISTYKGEGPKTALLVSDLPFFFSCGGILTGSQGVIKRLRFGIPVGLEKIPADWAKVVSFAEYALTQTRSKTKKSVRANSIFDFPASRH
jgi:hypothetical protein